MHVDEGVLHAYLDGAIDSLAAARALPRGVTPAEVESHLRSCSDCRALLERERAVRDEAGGILHATALASVELPPFPFEQVPAGPSRRRRVLPVAWAASVLLALGAGWWGSAAWRDGGPGEPMAGVAADSPAPVAAGGPPAGGDSAGVSPAAAEPGGLADASVAGRNSAAAAQADAPRPPGATGELAMAPEPQVADDGADGSLAGDSRIRANLTTGVPAVVTVAQLPRGDGMQPTVRQVARDLDPTAVAAAGEAAPSGSVSGQQLGFTAAPTSRLPGVQQSALQGGAFTGGARLGRPAAAPRLDVPTSRAPLPLDTFRELVNAARSGRLEWQPATPRDAGVTPLLLLQDAQVELLDAASAEGGSSVVRVRQLLADGTAVELLQWRETTAQNRAAGIAEGTTVGTVVVASGAAPQGGRELLLRVPALDGYLMLTADLDARRLAALADALVLMR